MIHFRPTQAGIYFRPASGQRGPQGPVGYTDATGAGLFATIADVEAATISENIEFIRTAVYSEASGAGGATYRRVVSEPGHTGKVRSFNGLWFELAESVWNVLMLGAVGDGITNDRVKFQDAITSGRRVVIPWTPDGYRIAPTNTTRCWTDNGGGHLVGIGKPRLICDTRADGNPWFLNSDTASGLGVPAGAAFLLSILGPNSVYKGLHFDLFHGTTAYPIRIGADVVDKESVYNTLFEDNLFTNGPSGIFCQSPENKFLNNKFQEMQGSCIALQGVNARRNKIDGFEGRNVFGAIQCRALANENSGRNIHKWTEPAKMTEAFLDAIVGSNSRTGTPWREYAEAGFLGGGVIEHTADVRDNRWDDFSCYGTRDSCFNPNGRRTIMTNFDVGNSVASAIAVSGSDYVIGPGRIRRVKVGLSLRVSFGGQSTRGRLTGITVTQCFGAGVEQIGENSTRRWVSDYEEDEVTPRSLLWTDDPDYFFSDDGTWIRFYRNLTNSHPDATKRQTGNNVWSGVVTPVHETGVNDFTHTPAGGQWTTAVTAHQKGTESSIEDADAAMILGFLSKIASGEGVTPTDNSMIGCDIVNNAGGDYLISTNGTLNLVAVANSNGVISDAHPQALGQDLSIRLRAVTTDATVTDITTDGAPRRYSVGASTGGIAAEGPGGVDAYVYEPDTPITVPTADQAPGVQPVITISFGNANSNTDNIYSMLDLGDEYGPMYLRQYNGELWDPATDDKLVEGTTYRFIRRIVHTEDDTVIQPPFDRNDYDTGTLDGWYHVRSSDTPHNTPSIRTGPGIYSVGGTVTAKQIDTATDPDTLEAKEWKFSCVLKRKSASVGTYEIFDFKKWTKNVTSVSATGSWNFTLTVDNTGSPRLAGLVLQATGEAAKTISWRAEIKAR